MRLDAYIRVSRVGGRNGESFISPDVQREKIEQWAKLRGVEIAKWHTDLDQSGGKLSRPAFDRALGRVQAGKTGGVVVAKLDRFSRAGVADALKLIESIIDADGQVASVEEGIDPTTPFGEFAMTVLLALARMQRRQVAENWREAQRRAVERGVHVASMAPTGYMRGEGKRLVANPATAPHIARIFEMKADGATWRELAMYLREHAVASPYGFTEWQPRALTNVISNRAYVGEARSGEFTNPAAHEAIVDEQTWQAAQQAKGERPANGMGGALLSGVLRCAGCGYILKPDTMSQRGVKRRLYRCRTERSSGRCPAPASVLGSVIEPYVVEQFMAGLGGMRAEGVAMHKELREAETALERAERELAAYLAAVSADDVGAQAFGDGARQRRQAVDHARATLDRIREKAGIGDLPLAADLEQTWGGMTVDDRRSLLQAGLDAVVIDRGRAPIDKRATVYWRGEAPADLDLRGRGWRGPAVMPGG
jgi:site-specific DNA recombinase